MIAFTHINALTETLTFSFLTMMIPMMITMMITMMMVNKKAPTTDPTMAPTGVPAGNINSKEKVKQHAILFIDLGQVFMLIEVEMAVRQHMTPAEQKNQVHPMFSTN